MLLAALVTHNPSGSLGNMTIDSPFSVKINRREKIPQKRTS